MMSLRQRAIEEFREADADRIRRKRDLENLLVQDAVALFSTKMNWQGEYLVIEVITETKRVRLDIEGILFTVDEYHIYHEETGRRVDCIADLGKVLTPMSTLIS